MPSWIINNTRTLIDKRLKRIDERNAIICLLEKNAWAAAAGSRMDGPATPALAGGEYNGPIDIYRWIN